MIGGVAALLLLVAPAAAPPSTPHGKLLVSAYVVRAVTIAVEEEAAAPVLRVEWSDGAGWTASVGDAVSAGRVTVGACEDEPGCVVVTLML